MLQMESVEPVELAESTVFVAETILKSQKLATKQKTIQRHVHKKFA